MKASETLPQESPKSTDLTPKEIALGKILRAGLLPNLISDRLDPLKAVEAAYAVGIRAIEVSCRRKDTQEMLQKVKREFPDIAVGVSSLIEDGAYFRFLQQRGPKFPSIAEAVDCGADFLVSVLPFSAETYERYDHLPIIPGVASADEAKRQLDLGAALVKFNNPERAGGADAFRAINGGPIHFGLPLLFTGGMRPPLIDAYVGARMLVSVAGFDLILSDRYQALQENFDEKEVRGRLKEYVDAFRAARQKHMPGVNFDSGDPCLIQKQTGQFMNMRMLA